MAAPKTKKAAPAKQKKATASKKKAAPAKKAAKPKTKKVTTKKAPAATKPKKATANKSNAKGDKLWYKKSARYYISCFVPDEHGIECVALGKGDAAKDGAAISLEKMDQSPGQFWTVTHRKDKKYATLFQFQLNQKHTGGKKFYLSMEGNKIHLSNKPYDFSLETLGIVGGPTAGSFAGKALPVFIWRSLPGTNSPKAMEKQHKSIACTDVGSNHAAQIFMLREYEGKK